MLTAGTTLGTRNGSRLEVRHVAAVSRDGPDYVGVHTRANKGGHEYVALHIHITARRPAESETHLPGRSGDDSSIGLLEFTAWDRGCGSET